jgi:hypothetical protein
MSADRGEAVVHAWFFTIDARGMPENKSAAVSGIAAKFHTGYSLVESGVTLPPPQGGYSFVRK